MRLNWSLLELLWCIFNKPPGLGREKETKKNQRGDVSTNSPWADVMVPGFSVALRLRLLWCPAGSVCLPVLRRSLSSAGTLLPGFGMPLQHAPFCFVSSLLIFCGLLCVPQPQPLAESSFSKGKCMEQWYIEDLGSLGRKVTCALMSGIENAYSNALL